MDDISYLLERFLSFQKGEKSSYFDIDDILTLIDYFLDKEDTVNLKTAIELGYELHPDNIKFKKALSKTLIAMEEYDFAMKMLDTIGELDDEPDVILMRIECLCELDRHDEVFKCIEKNIENDNPYIEEILEQTSCILNDVGKRVSDVYNFIQHALTMFPNDYVLRSELCFNYELQGKTQEAMALCNALIDENPFSPDVWYMQGRLYSLCLEFEKAVNSFDFALTCIDDDSDVELACEIQIMKAYCLYKNKNYQKAIETYSDLLLEDNRFIDAQVEPFLAECYMKIDDYEQAYQVLKKLVKKKDLEDKVSVFGNFIYCCIKTERREEVIKTLSDDALGEFPHSFVEYLSMLNIKRDQLIDDTSEGKGVIFPNDLVRDYIGNNIHNN